jgi:hypothetical protein
MQKVATFICLLEHPKSVFLATTLALPPSISTTHKQLRGFFFYQILIEGS